VAPRSRGGHPTTELLDVQVINIVLDINWTQGGYWRHVAVEWCYHLLALIARRCFLSAISQAREVDTSVQPKRCRPTHKGLGELQENWRMSLATKKIAVLPGPLAGD
jgi:hypothetical protein